MLEFICFFMPAFIALSIVLFLDMRNRKAHHLMCIYSVFCVLINLFSFLIVGYIFGKINLDFLTSTGYIIKWLSLASSLALIMGFLFVIIKRNMFISFELLKYEDEKK